MKVVINDQYGGFGLSHEAIMFYCKLKGYDVTITVGKNKWDITYWICPKEDIVEFDNAAFYAMSLKDRAAYNKEFASKTLNYSEIDRDDPCLVQTVNELGSKVASGEHAKLKIVSVPKDVIWEITYYDGLEKVREVSREFH